MDSECLLCARPCAEPWDGLHGVVLELLRGIRCLEGGQGMLLLHVSAERVTAESEQLSDQKGEKKANYRVTSHLG